MSMSSVQKSCYVCDICVNPMKRCTACRKIIYCTRVCQIQDWPRHRQFCKLQVGNDKSTHESQTEGSPCIPDLKLGNVGNTNDSNFINETIYVRANHAKYTMEVNKSLSGQEIFNSISHCVNIPLEKLKLIHKGKKMDDKNVRSFIKNKAVFQAFGERNEDENGLNPIAIAKLMEQMSVDRNTAVKALRQNKDLITAILWLGNQ